MKKRLNTNFICQDLRHHLGEEIKNGKNGSNIDIIRWMAEYDETIKNNHKEIENKFQILFPTAIVRLQRCCDDDYTYFVKIYGIDRNQDKKILNDMCEEIGFNDLNSDYMLIPSIVDEDTMKKYYSDIYQEYVKRNTP